MDHSDVFDVVIGM